MIGRTLTLAAVVAVASTAPVLAQEAPKVDAPVYVASGVTLRNFDSMPSISIGTLVTIRPNGELVYGHGYTPDEAARRFWEAIAVHRNGTPEDIARLREVIVTTTWPPELYAAALKRLGISKDDPTTRTEQRLVKAATEETPAEYEEVVIPLPTPLERVQAWLL